MSKEGPDLRKRSKQLSAVTADGLFIIVLHSYYFAQLFLSSPDHRPACLLLSPEVRNWEKEVETCIMNNRYLPPMELNDNKPPGGNKPPKKLFSPE